MKSGTPVFFHSVGPNIFYFAGSGITIFSWMQEQRTGSLDVDLTWLRTRINMDDPLRDNFKDSKYRAFIVRTYVFRRFYWHSGVPLRRMDLVSLTYFLQSQLNYAFVDFHKSFKVILMPLTWTIVCLWEDCKILISHITLVISHQNA